MGQFRKSGFMGEQYPRVSYMTSLLALINMVAILPIYLSYLIDSGLRFLLVLRLKSILRLTHCSSAMSMLLDVFREEVDALFAGFLILIVFLVFAASGAYLVEYEAQPDKFGSISAVMCWTMATLTTVGNGNVSSITLAG